MNNCDCRNAERFVTMNVVDEDGEVTTFRMTEAQAKAVQYFFDNDYMYDGFTYTILDEHNIIDLSR